jgi:hypothetical protein
MAEVEEVFDGGKVIRGISGGIIFGFRLVLAPLFLTRVLAPLLFFFESFSKFSALVFFFESFSKFSEFHPRFQTLSRFL